VIGDALYRIFEGGRILLGVLLLLLALLFVYCAVTDEFNLVLAAGLCAWGGLSVLKGYDVLD
jgi:hypothetical protein